MGTFYSNYEPQTTTLTSANIKMQPVETQSAITSCREVTEKYLHLLAEEISGLSGTFGPVLRSRPPQAENAPTEKAMSSCELVEFLNGINSRINYLVDEVRSLRDRCEL